MVWVNSTNLFDPACGFGGYRESGFGREGGREGLLEYLEPNWFRNAPQQKIRPSGRASAPPSSSAQPVSRGIDRTVKLYIGGKQVRPDSGYSMEVRGTSGNVLGEVPLGNRKDIRNAVEAARGAEAWGKTTAHNRAQVLYYIAENLSQRAQEITRGLADAAGLEQAQSEVRSSIERLFSYAAWNEPVGTIGIVCPAEAPLLALVSLVAPAIAMGNTVVAVPSENYPLIIGDLYQVLETSDLPEGVVNLVSGNPAELLPVLAEHDGVAAIWCFGDEAASGRQPQASVRQRRACYRLVRPGAGRRALVSAACHASQEYLGPLRGVTSASRQRLTPAIPNPGSKLRPLSCPPSRRKQVGTGVPVTAVCVMLNYIIT